MYNIFMIFGHIINRLFMHSYILLSMTLQIKHIPSVYETEVEMLKICASFVRNKEYMSYI